MQAGGQARGQAGGQVAITLLLPGNPPQNCNIPNLLMFVGCISIIQLVASKATISPIALISCLFVLLADPALAWDAP